MITLTLYSRPDCCLCEELKHTLARVQRDISFVVHAIDISTDPVLESRFGEEIPVLFINGRKAFKYRVTASELRTRLLREKQGSPVEETKA